MRLLAPRLLTHALPTAILLAVCGYMAAHWVGAWVATDHDSGEALTDALKWRLPLGMAAWGGGIVAVYEVFRAVWAKPPAAEKATKEPEVDGEQLLLQLLAQADAAERARQTGDSVAHGTHPILTDTPAPACGSPARALA